MVPGLLIAPSSRARALPRVGLLCRADCPVWLPRLAPTLAGCGWLLPFALDYPLAVIARVERLPLLQRIITRLFNAVAARQLQLRWLVDCIVPRAPPRLRLPCLYAAALRCWLVTLRLLPLYG